MGADQEPDAAQRLAPPGSRVKHDRRRPSRTEVNLALIPLLRGSAPFVEPLPIGRDAYKNAGQGSFDFRIKAGPDERAHLDALDDGGNPARAIVLAVLLSLPFWVAAAAVCQWLVPFEIGRQHVFDPFHERADAARQVMPMGHHEGHVERLGPDIR